MGAEVQRSIPVPAIGNFFAFFRLGTDINVFAADFVVTDQSTILPLGINNIFVGGINYRTKAITTYSDDPVGVFTTIELGGSMRSAQSVIVLGSAIDVIERFGVIHCSFIELGDRQVGEIFIGFASVISFVETTVTTYKEPLRIMLVK